MNIPSIEVGRQSTKHNSLTKRIITAGMVSVALLASGCNLSKATQPKKEMKADANDHILHRVINPSLAKLASDAARFDRDKGDTVTGYSYWYLISKNQQQLELSSEDDSYEATITLKKGVSKRQKKFKSGQVDSVEIEIPGQEMRMYMVSENEKCPDSASADYGQYGSDGELENFFDTDECLTWGTRLTAYDPISAVVVSSYIATKAQESMEKVMQQVDK